MKTTIDIPDNELNELLDNAKKNTKREAVLSAIREYNERRRRGRLVSILGTFENLITAEELEDLRSAE